MNERSLQLPGSPILLVAMWSSVELLVCMSGLDTFIDSRLDGTIASLVVAFCVTGLMASWLFVLTWLLLGARPKANSMHSAIDTIEFNVLVTRDHLFRIAILGALVAEMTLIAFSTINGQRLLAGFVAFAIPCLAWPTGYRQISGRRIAKFEPQVAASLDIRGIMLVTALIALATGLCRGSERLEANALAVTLAVGASAGLMWLSIILWMLTRKRSWFVVSVFGALLPIGIVAQVTLLQRTLGPDLVDEAAVGSLTMYIHAIVYFGALRACDYRLALDTSSTNLR